MKNGSIISSDLQELNKLYKAKKLPYPAFRQDMDGITIYITKINDIDLEPKESFSLTYIPHSEIESIDYTIDFNKTLSRSWSRFYYIR